MCAPACLYVHHTHAGALGSQKRVLDPCGLHLQDRETLTWWLGLLQAQQVLTPVDLLLPPQGSASLRSQGGNLMCQRKETWGIHVKKKIQLNFHKGHKRVVPFYSMREYLEG